MKQLLSISFLIIGLFLVGCEEEGKIPPEKIDEAADEMKEGLDDLIGQARIFLDGDGPEKLKDLIDEIAEKGKGVNEDSDIWRIKLEEVKNDPEINRLIKKYEGRGKEIERKLERFEKEIEENDELKRKLDAIDSREEFSEFIENYEGKGKDILIEFEETLTEIEDSGIIERKIKELENDEDLKKLLKRYENEGKEILRELENILTTRPQ